MSARRLARTPAQHGAVLLLVLLLLAASSLLMLQGARTMQVDMTSTAIYVKKAQADSLLAAGLELAGALLSEDLADNEYDHFGEDWNAYFEKNEEDGGKNALKFTTGTLEATISDESGKFPLNALLYNNGTDITVNEPMRGVLERLIIYQLGVPEETAKQAVAAIVDWMDADEEPYQGIGAETAFYQTMDPPYASKNAALASLDELSLIRGIGTEEFKGRAKLMKLLTVRGEGKININTAPRALLEALPQGPTQEESKDLGEEFADAVIEFRSAEENYEALQDPGWPRTLFGFEDREAVKLPDDYLTTTSNLFSVYLHADVDEVARTLVALVERSKPPETGPEADKAYVNVIYQELY